MIAPSLTTLLGHTTRDQIRNICPLRVFVLTASRSGGDDWDANSLHSFLQDLVLRRPPRPFCVPRLRGHAKALWAHKIQGGRALVACRPCIDSAKVGRYLDLRKLKASCRGATPALATAQSPAPQAKATSKTAVTCNGRRRDATGAGVLHRRAPTRRQARHRARPNWRLRAAVCLLHVAADDCARERRSRQIHIEFWERVRY